MRIENFLARIQGVGIDKFLPKFSLIVLIIFFLSGCVTNIPSEVVESESYQLHQPQKVIIGNRVFRSSHAIYSSLFVALQDFDEPGQSFYNLNPIKKGMIFNVVKEQNGNYLIQSINFDSKGNLAILITKNGEVVSNKPLRSMLFGGANLTQKAWSLRTPKLFERISASNSYDSEVIYRGSSEKFSYFQYREYVPGSSTVNYQEILKFDVSSDKISIINRTIKILGHSAAELIFSIEETGQFSGYANFEVDKVVAYPLIDSAVNSVMRELDEPKNPRDALLEVLLLASENYWGLYYDRMDSYSKGRVDSLVNVYSAQVSDPNLSQRAKYIWMVKPGNSVQDKFAEIWSDKKIKILNMNETKEQAEIQIQYESGKTELIYMLLENGSWKFNVARTMESKKI